MQSEAREVYVLYLKILSESQGLANAYCHFIHSTYINILYTYTFIFSPLFNKTCQVPSISNPSLILMCKHCWMFLKWCLSIIHSDIKDRTPLLILPIIYCFATNMPHKHSHNAWSLLFTTNLYANCISLLSTAVMETLTKRTYKRKNLFSLWFQRSSSTLWQGSMSGEVARVDPRN